MMKRFLAALAAATISLALYALPAPAANIALDGNLSGLCGTATGTSNASTLANKCGVITTESATTAAGATFTETVTDTVVAATDLCFASVSTGGTGTPAVTKVTPGSGSLVVVVQNIHASAAFNNTLAISYLCIKP